MSDLFYVISVHHTPKYNKFILFWRPDDKGYCFKLGPQCQASGTGAGRYTRETIMAHLNGYYNTGDTNIAVAVEVVDAMTVMTTDEDMLDGPHGPAVLNTPANWRKLLKAVIAPPKNKPKPKAIYFGKNNKD